MLEKIDVQFMLHDLDTGYTMRVDHHVFESTQGGEIEYDRSTVFNNGSRHITLTKADYGYEIEECSLCGESCYAEDQITTECGASVGECCHDELRSTECHTHGEVFYYVK